uniref:Uncharacterized protein n=1 Tax=Oryza sativa subsp. japonica TaxID=39947 RepID=Q6YUM8_ORYSJ|nr:hypothetical protein [Oryza sativa Japonica Group]
MIIEEDALGLLTGRAMATLLLPYAGASCQQSMRRARRAVPGSRHVFAPIYSQVTWLLWCIGGREIWGGGSSSTFEYLL